MTAEGLRRLRLVGRLHGVTRARLGSAAASRGFALVGGAGRADVVALAHGSAATVLAGTPPADIAGSVGRGATLVSENGLRRLLGFPVPDGEAVRTLSPETVARAAGLDLAVLEALSLYDVVGPTDGPMAFRDLLAAKETGRLLGLGVPLAAVVDAATRLASRGRDLADTRLADAPEGLMARLPGGGLATLDGQLALDLEDRPESADALFAAAEAAEAEGNPAAAERLYRRAAAVDPADPTIPFNLGNVLDAAGRPRDAALEWRRALSRDPGFAEAWLNLAVVAEAAGRMREADRCYLAALSARPGLREAVYSRALFLTRAGRTAEAIAGWRAVLDAGDPADAGAARRMLAILGGGVSRPSP